MQWDVTNYVYDLTNHYGVPRNRIVLANNGNACCSNDLYQAIQMVANANPPCDKIFVRLNAHGSRDFRFFFSTNCAPRWITAAQLCNMLQPLANKGVPICLLLDCCFSGGIVPSNNWNFPAGSVILTATDAGTPGLGGDLLEIRNQPAVRQRMLRSAFHSVSTPARTAAPTAWL